jgi:hypothetical protein
VQCLAKKIQNSNKRKNEIEQNQKIAKLEIANKNNANQMNLSSVIEE